MYTDFNTWNSLHTKKFSYVYNWSIYTGSDTDVIKITATVLGFVNWD